MKSSFPGIDTIQMPGVVVEYYDSDSGKIKFSDFERDFSREQFRGTEWPDIGDQVNVIMVTGTMEVVSVWPHHSKRQLR